MQINLEQHTPHSVQAYTDDALKINDTMYKESLLVHKDDIITDYALKSITDLEVEPLLTRLSMTPDIIIIGRNDLEHFPSPAFLSAASQKRIGVETMSVSAACRTYNVLLSEDRSVVLCILR